jgi:hypothetical protein
MEDTALADVALTGIVSKRLTIADGAAFIRRTTAGSAPTAFLSRKTACPSCKGTN